MAEENDKFWMRAQPELQRAMGLVPLTLKGAEKECKQGTSSQLPECDINSIMEFVMSWGEKGGLGSQAPDSAGITEDPTYADAEEMNSELMELVNRNKGEQDPDSEELLKKHRSEALSGGSENEDKNGDSKDKTGSTGGTDTAGASS